LDHGGPALIAIENRGAAQGEEAEQEAEFGSAARIEAGKISADDCRHRTTGAGPHRDTLQGADAGGTAWREIREVGASGCEHGTTTAPEFSIEHEEGAGDLGDDDGADGEEVIVDPIVCQQAEHDGGDKGDEDIEEEAKSGGVAAE
jgi:hypothetical protein